MSAQSSGRALNRLEVLAGLRVATWEAAWSTGWLSLTSGAFLTGFALWLGAGSIAMGIVTAVPVLAALVQLVSALPGESLASRRRFTAAFTFAGRALWLPILAVPFILGRPAALWAVVGLLLASYILLNIPTPAYTSWMSDLVPVNHRGRYFGRRNMLAGIVGMAVTLPAARFLDSMSHSEAQRRAGFAVLFAAAVVGGIGSFVCLLRQAEPPRELPPRPVGASHVASSYMAPLRDRNFARLLLFNAVFAVGQNFAAPFWNVYALQELHLSYTWLQVFAAVTGLTGLVSMPVWGYLGDKFGNKPLLLLSVVGVVTTPLSWVFANANHPGWMFALLTELNIVGGICWAGVGLTQFNLLIHMSPPERTPIYVATMSAAVGLAGGIAPLLGSAAMTGLGHFHVTFCHLPMKNFQVVFATCSVIRIASLLLLKPVVDSHASTAGEVLEHLRSARPQSWLHMRRLQRASDPAVRAQATRALGGLKTRIAATELEEALRDPDNVVREQAARALGEIADSRSAAGLIAAVADPALGIAAEAAWALGRIGDPAAVPVLIRVLADDVAAYSRAARLSAVQALARIGGPTAAAALAHELQSALAAAHPDAETVEALAFAAGSQVTADGEAALARGILRNDLPRPARLALIRAAGQVRGESVVGPMRSLVLDPSTDASLLPALAEALAHHQDRRVLPELFSYLATARSSVVRRQIGFALASMVDCGEEMYSLLALDEFARDAAVERMFADLRRSYVDPDQCATVDQAEAAYIGGDIARSLQFLACLDPGSAADVASAAAAVAARHTEPAPEALFVLILALTNR